MDSPVSGGSGAGAATATRGASLVRFTDRVLSHVFSWGLLTIAIGLAPGLAVWPLLHPDELDFIINGALDVDLRLAVLEAMGLSLLAVLALYGLAYLLLRLRGPKLSFAETALRLNRYSFVVVALPLLTALMHRGIEVQHEFITLVLIGVITAVLGVFIHRLLANWPELPAGREPVPWPRLVPFVVIGLFLFYAIYISSLALLDHRNLGTHVFDLAIYDNIFWHNANGTFMGCSFCKTGRHMSSHFDPILFLLSPIYRLYPRAETILVLQTVWLALGVFPLFLIAKKRLQNPWLGVLLGVVYVLYPALHGANMFDFHSLTLLIPSLLWAIYLIDSGSRVALGFVVVLMLLTREDVSLLTCFVGAYAILQRRPVTGIVMIVGALTYLVLIKLYVMADPGLIMAGNKDSTSFHYFYEEMIPHEEEGMKGLVITMLTNPVYTLRVLFKEEKIFFFLALLGPLLFLPLASGRKSVMMIYGFVFIGAATRRYMFSLYFQYSAVLFPILLASLPDAIARVSGSRVAQVFGLKPRRLTWTLMWTCVVATLLVTHKYGVLWPNDAFRAGWNPLARGSNSERTERYEYMRGLIDEHIAPDASVCASSSLGPHVSNREGIYKWPSTTDADYILVHSKTLKKKNKRRLERLVKNGSYRLLGSEHGIELYEKLPEEERDRARAAARLGEVGTGKPAGPEAPSSGKPPLSGGKGTAPDASRDDLDDTDDEDEGDVESSEDEDEDGDRRPG